MKYEELLDDERLIEALAVIAEEHVRSNLDSNDDNLALGLVARTSLTNGAYLGAFQVAWLIVASGDEASIENLRRIVVRETR